MPVLLAAFFAMALTPVAMRLQRAKVPAPLAAILSFLLGTVLILGLAGLVGVALQDVDDRLPVYEERINSGVADATSWLSDKGVDVPEGGIASAVNPEQAVEFATTLVASLGATLCDAIVVLLAMLFMMSESARITGDVRASQATGSVGGKLQRVMKAVTDYLSVKTFVSLLTGLFFGVACALIGVDFPVLWDLLAFLLNYVPNIGSVLAAIPPILVALVQHVSYALEAGPRLESPWVANTLGNTSLGVSTMTNAKTATIRGCPARIAGQAKKPFRPPNIIWAPIVASSKPPTRTNTATVAGLAFPSMPPSHA